MDDDATARAIIDAGAYMTIATADADGLPWATPVWFAPDEDGRRFYWVSDPAARHSANLAVRPQLSLAIFDSHAPIGTGRGVYVAAVADQPAGAELEHAVAVFSARSLAQGGVAWCAADVSGDARLRLYRATAAERWIGDRNDQRVPLSG
jgi:nitroimidazol reductase NimA-like FMN-containing flavoprotein (pyridoxamine 5'-phosphate oxidase superfamily)